MYNLEHGRMPVGNTILVSFILHVLAFTQCRWLPKWMTGEWEEIIWILKARWAEAETHHPYTCLCSIPQPENNNQKVCYVMFSWKESRWGSHVPLVSDPPSCLRKTDWLNWDWRWVWPHHLISDEELLDKKAKDKLLWGCVDTAALLFSLSSWLITLQAFCSFGVRESQNCTIHVYLAITTILCRIITHLQIFTTTWHLALQS